MRLAGSGRAKGLFWGNVLVMMFHSSGAMSLARQILLCIEDFQEQNPTLSSAWTQKLDYADSDLLRIGNIVRRLRQFLRVRAGQPFEEVPITIRDLQYAVNTVGVDKLSTTLP